MLSMKIMTSKDNECLASHQKLVKLKTQKQQLIILPYFSVINSNDCPNVHANFMYL